jgi:type III pantothenate kinase
VASVHRGLEAQLAAGVRRARPQDAYVQLHAGDFPLEVDVLAPQRVGTDRLAAAVAANTRRAADRGAIIVDAGTAVTVDLVTADGVFRGGAILPGLPVAARALRLATDALPLLDAHDLTTLPPALGKSTEAAMRSGLIWGCVAAVRELISQLAVDLVPAPEIFCTGGLGQPLCGWLNRPVTYAPQLVLHGIALAGYHHMRHAAGPD